MLLWINGPFGVGKTQTAHELARRLPGSTLCDPEHVGFGLHRMSPPSLRGDFQDLRSWRDGVFEVLDLSLGAGVGPIVVPMTVIRSDYLEQTVGRLRAAGHDVHHFTLLAEPDTVRVRLRERGFGRAVRLVVSDQRALRREGFALSELEEGLAAMTGPEFAEQIWTDYLTIDQVVERIAASAGLALNRPPDGPVRGRARRATVAIKHLRLD
jgi:DNA polymerase III delta prime subunit